ncbi:MAG: alpha,alpha-trehalase [Verrucomicrobia bacterium]|nr:alpha,alpha-trehalase [Verrucomicrobiota bacterium]
MAAIPSPKRHTAQGHIPTFEGTRDRLPAPIYDENPAFVACYWKAWELAFRNFHLPTEQNGFVSPFIDAAFNQNIFLWDTCFMTMFCNYAHGLTPGIASLDNFYVKQHDTGEVNREIDRTTGHDFEPWINRDDRPLFSRWGWWAGDSGNRGAAPVEYRGRDVPSPNPRCTLDALDHPLFAWAEMEAFRVTGDVERLRRVWSPLTRYYAALHKYLRQGNGLYMTDWASMDNSQRNPHLARGGTAVDTSSEMVLFARLLAEMADVLIKPNDAAAYRAEADSTAARINALMWDEARQFYFDLSVDGAQGAVKTIAAFWTLLAGVALPQQAAALVRELENPATFKTLHRVPSLAANESQFTPDGHYWCGGVWPSTNMMVVRGLDRCGFADLARTIALNHVEHVTAVFLDTDTLWEDYAPMRVAPGNPARPDFVGWTGIGPISFLLECAVGLRPDAPARTLTWTIRTNQRVGCERYRLGGRIVSLICEPPDGAGRRELSVESDGGVHLHIRLNEQSHRFDVKAGKPLRVCL